MAECHKSLDEEEGFLALTVIGKVTADEVITWINDIYTLTKAFNILWDYSDGDLSGLTADDIQDILETARKYELVRSGGKTAFVVQNKGSFSVGALYEFMGDIEGYKVKTAVFKNKEEAVNWLKG